MAANPVSKPASRSKGRTRPAVCALCQGPYRIPVVFKGQTFCRFCFDHLKNEGAINQPSPEDDSKVKKEEVGKEEKDTEEKEVCRQCSEHGENLIWFCVQETALLCEVCKASGDHASHTVVPVEDAAQEYKGKLQHAVDLLEEHLEESEKQAYQEGKKTAIWKASAPFQVSSEFFILEDTGKS
nr:E3 ubiquitin-protein ligase TRIM21-like [Anolis sagrei ordinatus]